LDDKKAPVYGWKGEKLSTVGRIEELLLLDGNAKIASVLKSQQEIARAKNTDTIKSWSELEGVDRKKVLEFLRKQKNEDMCWYMIDCIGWGTKSTDYEKLRDQLHEYFCPEDIKDLKEFVNDRRKELVKRLGEFVDMHDMLDSDKRTFWGTGDDSFWDLTAHIVGLGKRAWELAMYNPNCVKKRADVHDYKENFQYIFNIPNSKKETELVSAVSCNTPKRYNY